MKKPINPCTPTCKKRTATCKFDGTCGLWDPYNAEQIKYRDKRYLMKTILKTHREERTLALQRKKRRV